MTAPELRSRQPETIRTRGGGTAGAVLARLTVAPTLLLAAWLVVSLPLLLADIFRPLPAVALFLPVAAAALWWGLRRVPERVTASWWAVAGVVGVAVAFGVLQGLMHAEEIVVRRDPGSYVQFTTWIAEHGSLPIPRFADVFGHGSWLNYESPAFYNRGGDIIPQFMAGLPLTLSVGHWLAGTSGVLLGSPALGAAGVLSFGGLVARLVGARWAPLGALALALAWPTMYVSRASYSEAAAMILLLGGLALLVDALGLDGRGARVCAGIAGLVLGLDVLVRIDGLRDVLPIVPYAGLLFARRCRLALPLAGGLAVGVAYGLVDGYVLSWPYLVHLSDSLNPLLAICGLVVVATLVVAPILRWRGVPSVARFKLPEVAGGLVVLGFVGFAVRPLLQTVRKAGSENTATFVGDVQRYEGLPYDPLRMYYEHSLDWVIWYIGLPVVILAVFGAALIVWGTMRGRGPRWVPVLLVLLWSVAATLWRPGITPDHPWASRRLAPIVIPALVLFAVWAVAWLTRRSKLLGWPGWAPRAIAVAGAVALALPPLLTSLPLIPSPIERGEVAGVRNACREIGPNAAVLFVERVEQMRFTQVFRGMCNTPTAGMADPTPEKVAAVVENIRASGRRPVLASWYREPLEKYAPDVEPVHAMDLHSRQDDHVLAHPPRHTIGMEMNVWLAFPEEPKGR